MPVSPANNPGQMQNPTNNLNAPQEPPLQAPTNP
jgi:hypothetical protein